MELGVHFGGDAAYEGISSLLDSNAKFDGIFACSDVIAMSAMRALTERGRRIPADVAVAGFDDIPLAAYTTPPLTTVRQDVARGARILVEKVIRAISGELTDSEVIPTELIVRGSSLRQQHQAANSSDRERRGSALTGRKASHRSG
jgi:DNA-binding LacI/PurR family transcriptional regulator